MPDRLVIGFGLFVILVYLDLFLSLHLCALERSCRESRLRYLVSRTPRPRDEIVRAVADRHPEHGTEQHADLDRAISDARLTHGA